MGILDQVKRTDEMDRAPFSILLFGGSGTGKTITSLLLAQRIGARPLVFDCDGGGAVIYGQGEDAIPFDVITSDDPETVLRGLRELCADARGYRTVIIDPISTVSTEIENKVDDESRLTAKKKISLYQSAVGKQGWQPIKRNNARLHAAIRQASICMPLICTARETNEWQGDDVIGLRPEGSKALPHEFSVVLHMQTTRAGHRMARVVKDRLQRLHGPLIELPTKETLANLLADTYHDLLGRVAIERPVCSEEQAEEVHTLVAALGLPIEQVTLRFRERYRVDRPEQLTPAQAGEVIASMRDRLETLRRNMSAASGAMAVIESAVERAVEASEAEPPEPAPAPTIPSDPQAEPSAKSA